MQDDLKEKVSNVLKFARPKKEVAPAQIASRRTSMLGVVVAGRDVTINFHINTRPAKPLRSRRIVP